MSHNPRIEVPGAMHLVVRRVRRGRPALDEFHDRHLSLAMVHGSLYRYGVQLVGYNMLPDRVLLVLIPKEPESIGLALMNSTARPGGGVHRASSPFWEREYSVCPFADEVAWRVLRYVDMASVRITGGDPLDRHVLNSAAEHAGFAKHGLLTAPPERLPNAAAWPIFVGTPEDEKFVQALELCLRTGLPFGPLSFVRLLEESSGRHMRPACRERPGLFADAGCQSHVESRPGMAGAASVFAHQVAH